MEQLRAELQACDAARGILRRYRIEASTDLLRLAGGRDLWADWLGRQKNSLCGRCNLA
jgi:hypothetical protein